MSPSEAEFLRFARWALPERSNAPRGVVAEWLVARAVDADLTAPRGEWDDHDVTTRSGTTVEVKSAAYLQAWITETPRPIVFSGRRCTCSRCTLPLSRNSTTCGTRGSGSSASCREPCSRNWTSEPSG